MKGHPAPLRRSRARPGLGGWLGWAGGFLILSASSLLAQANPLDRYFHRVIGPDHGLPDTQVNALAQTPDGYLWLGTRRGVVRYDGLSFELLNRDRQPGLPSDWITALAADKRGRLWIGTSRGLAVLDHGRITQVAAVPRHDVWTIFADRADRIWVGTDSLLFVGSEAGMAPVPGAAGNRIYAIFEDRRGDVWFGGRNQFGWARPDSARSDPAVAAALGGVVYAFAEAESGFWVATRQGIHRVTPDGNRKAAIGPVISTGPGNHPVRGLAKTPDGLVWMGTNGGGLFVWDGRRLERFTTDHGLSSRQVLGITVDSRGRIWAGSGAGLDRFQPTAFTTFSSREGLPNESIWAVQGSDRRAWATAFDGSVLVESGSGFKRVLPSSGAGAGSIPIWPSQRGGIWAAQRLRHLVRIVASGQIVERHPPYPSIGDILGIFEDRRGALWLSADSGLFRLEGRRLESFSPLLGLTGRGPRVITEDSAGRVYLSGPPLIVIDGDSVARIGPAQGLTDPDVFALFPEGPNLWIGGADSGLFLLRGGQVSQLGHRDPRLRREILGITDDGLGYLWLTSSYGLIRADRDDLLKAADRPGSPVDIRSFDRDDGLATTEFNGDFQSRIYRDSAGRLWLPSYAGVVRVDPERIAADTAPPQVWIERLLVDGKPLDPRGPVELHPGVGRFEVSFAATDALVPSRVRIQHRMTGVDEEWIDAGARRTASYGPLRGGSYQFAVRAANEDGRWSLDHAMVSVKVDYRLHERPEFRLTLVIGLGLTAWWLNRIRLRRLQDRQQRLSDLVTERTADLAAARDQLEQRVAERTQALAHELAERKRLEQQLVQSQKLESIGRLAGGVAHEINNMMTGVLGFTNMAAAAASDRADIQADLDQVRRAGERAALITKQLLAFARRQQSQRDAVDVAVAIRDLDRFISQMAGPGIAVSIECDDAKPIVADRSQIDQLIVNLVMNARDAMPHGGQLSIRATMMSLNEVTRIEATDLLPGDYLKLEVIDTGVGMSPAVKSRLFEPFFTTKEVNRGSGLGLAVCFGIVTQHGGAIAVDSEPGQGTRFEIWLPVGVVVESREPAAPAASSEPRRGTETILIVEDEEAVRLVASRTLSSLGYQVLTAKDGLDGLAVFAKHKAEIRLLLTDLLMPGLSGPELASRCRDHRPDLRVIVMSGFAGPEPDGFDRNALGPMLAKPFDRGSLAAAVRRELDRAPSPSHGQPIAQPGRDR